jgi:ABC-2 type transport system permease protein
MMLNPFTAILQQSRHALVAPSHSTVPDVLGSGWLVLAPVAIGAAVVALGYRVFSWRAPRIAEQL